MPSQIDREKTARNIERILEKINLDADPHVLNEYRRVFKKNISILRRSWASAYLLMLFDQGELGGRADKSRGRRDRGESRPRQSGQGNASHAGAAERASGPQGKGKGADTSGEPRAYPLADEESKQLFISVGRNRRVFPREILGVINSKTAIPKDDIGAIRILDNYSFVQVRDTVADQIIEALNGMTFRGRTLTVNYAKSRKDEEKENGGNDSGGSGEDGGGNGYGGAEDDGPDSRDAFEQDGDNSEYSQQDQEHPEKEDI